MGSMTFPIIQNISSSLRRKNMSSYSIYIQIKSTVQPICLILYLIVNAEVAQSNPKESDCKQFYTTKGYHKTESASFV